MAEFFTAIGNFITTILNLLGSIVSTIFTAIGITGQLALMPGRMSAVGWPDFFVVFFSLSISLVLIRIVLKLI